MPHNEKPQGGKLNSHDAKIEHHNHDHEKVMKAKQQVRMERHSGTGHSIREGPKKGGAGCGTVWGSVEDEIKDAMRSH